MRPRLTAILALATVLPLAACHRAPPPAPAASQDAIAAVALTSLDSKGRPANLSAAPPPSLAAAQAEVQFPPNTLGPSAMPGPSPTLDARSNTAGE